MNRQRRALLTLIALVAAVFFGVPTIKEGADSECAALSARIVAPIAADYPKTGAAGLMSLFAGKMTTAMVMLRFPNIPTGLACTGLYWRTLYDPEFLRQLQQ